MAEKPIIVFNKILVIIFCFNYFQLFAQSTAAIKNFNTSNGLPQNAISGMVFDNTGYLWLAAAYGLIRYDGFGFKTFLPDTASNQTNVSNQVLAIFNIGPERKVFIRTKNGLLHTIRDGRLVPYDSTINNTTFTYGLRGHFPNVEIFKKFNLSYDELVNKHEWDANTREILPVNKTDFIVLSNNKRILFYYRNGIKQNSIPLENEFNFFLKAGSSSLLVDFNDNLYLYDNVEKKFEKINNPVDAHKSKSRITEKPAWYWDTYNDESYCYYNAVFYQLKVDSAARKLMLMPCFSIEKGDHLWTGVMYDPVNSIYYLRTLEEGLFQVKLKPVQTFNLTTALAINRNAQNAINYSLLKTSDSTVLTTTGFEFTSSIHGTTIKRKGTVYSNRETINLLADTGIICAEENQVFYYLRTDNFLERRIYNDSFNRHNPGYITLLQPEGDSLWVGTGQSIYCIGRKKVNLIFTPVKSERSIFTGIRLFYRLSKDIALISNDFGLYKLHTSAPYVIDSFPEMKDKQVRHVSAYKDALLLSVYKHGLYVFRNNLFYKVPVREDQPGLQFCHSTYIDGMGDLWVTTDNELFRSSISALMESVSKPASPPFFFSYGETDGIDNPEFNGGGTPSYALLTNGQLFYPSMGGIVTFKTADLNDTLLRSPIPVERIETDNTVRPFLSDSIYLRADFNYLNIILGVPHFGAPGNLLLEYKLGDNGWKRIDVSPSQRINLYNLSSGYHKLLIRRRVAVASNDYVYKTLAIFRAKHIYERLWFYPVLAVVFGLLFFLIVKLQTRNIAVTRLKLRKLVAEQTAELSKTAESKELLINIISHDMVTPIKHISLIAGFLEKGLETDPKEIDSALLDIESTAEKILTGSQSIISYMKYNRSKVIVHKKSTNIYGFVNEVCSIFFSIAKEKNIRLTNNVTRSRFSEIDENIFSIILNNIISNAIKYSGKGEVVIFVEEDSETNTILKIKDTGKGMSKETLHVVQELLKGNLRIVKTINKASTGLGYMLISELIKAHELSVSVESEADAGTTVSIFIP